MKNPYASSPSKKQLDNGNKIFSAPSKNSIPGFSINAVRPFNEKKSKDDSKKGRNKIKGKMLPIGMKEDTIEEPIINEYQLKNLLRGDFYVFTLKSNCFYCIDKLIKLRAKFPNIKFHMYYMEEYTFDYEKWSDYAKKQLMKPNNGLFYLFLKDKINQYSLEDLYKLFKTSYIDMLNNNKLSEIGITFHQIMMKKTMKDFYYDLFKELVQKPTNN